jgi:DNA-binding response OmpR family regulator
MKVLLLEDDICLSDIIYDFLEELDCEVIRAYDGETAECLLYNTKFDLLLFDINVPKPNGIELLKQLRCKGYRIPIIIMTSSLEISLLEEAFKSGCDDYLKKPFHLKELDMRLTYIKNLYKINTYEIIYIDNNIYFDSSNMSLSYNGNTITLPKKEAAIFMFFLTNPNRIISVDELILNVWEYDITPSIATIRTYIKNIRKKLNNRFIITIKGVGYKFQTTTY